MNRQEIIDQIVSRLFKEGCLNTHDFEDTDSLIESAKELIENELKTVVIVSGRVLC